MRPPRTAVVVLNWNRAEETRACLRSLAAAREEWALAIVVDNGSAGGPPSGLEDELPGVDVVETGANLGYAGGNNRGIRRALEQDADAVLILNNDAAVEPGAITLLREAAAGAGPLLCGPTVLGPYGMHAGGRVTFRPFRSREGAPPPGDGFPFDVDYVPGCAVLATRETIERVGVFDERFFLTWEDTDWSARVRAAGGRCLAVPAARVRHAGSRSFGATFSPLYAYYYFRNMMLFARLHAPFPERPRAYRDALSYAVAVYLRRKPGEHRRFATAAGLGIVHFVAGRFGPGPAFLTRQAHPEPR